MLVLNIRNNNLYLVGKIGNKEYLLNGVCKFELTEERSQHLVNAKIDYSIVNNRYLINDIMQKIKNQFTYDFHRIEFR